MHPAADWLEWSQFRLLRWQMIKLTSVLQPPNCRGTGRVIWSVIRTVDTRTQYPDTTGSWQNPAAGRDWPAGMPSSRCYKCENDTDPPPRCLPGA